MGKITIHIKSLLFMLLCWLAGFFVNTMFPMVYQSIGQLACFLFGICSLGVVGCIYGDWCLKMANKQHLRTDTPEMEKKKQHYGLIVGIAPTVVNYIYVIILYLSRAGIIAVDFYAWFKTLTIYFMPFSYIVAPNTAVYVDGRVTSVNVPATELSAWAMVLFTVLPLFFLLVCWGFYYIGYNRINVKDKILYRPKK